MAIFILLAKLKNCCKSSSGKFGATLNPPYSPDLAPNLSSKHLSGTNFSSNSDVKTAAANWLNGQGRNFYRTGLNKLVLSSDKCQNRFGHYEEK
ncbi:hypothetical protein AVEN_73343-1 [Araneus ventricosus]|uniref:Tc1-like transposase DDE domain-containing protein n=1 Tax=Araneus ventricosus TaxID=182803 RepID=A0A4Y2NP07_ARAVE|nr:hypothetical protein AVEN_73343-1 [Araneus ventricosus]